MTAALVAPSTLVDGEVTLLPVDDAVAALLVAASYDEEITRWTGVPKGMTLLDAGLLTAGWASNPSVVRLQVRAGEPTPVGMVTVWINKQGQPEVGYWLLESGRGRGVARIAVRLLCDWAFTACEFERLQLTTMLGNTASERVAAACGFQPAGTVDRELDGETRTLRLWIRYRDALVAGDAQRAAIGT